MEQNRQAMGRLYTGNTGMEITYDTLASLGWNGYFTSELKKLLQNNRMPPMLQPARVLEVRRGSFLVGTLNTDDALVEVEAKPSGRLSNDCQIEAAWPATGDWVALRSRPQVPGGKTVLVEAVIKRRSSISRKAAGDTQYDKVQEQVVAANVDTAFIVTAAGSDFHVRRIERYATLALESGVNPVLVVTKADLAGDGILDLVSEANEACPFAPAFAVCAPEGKGLEAFDSHLKPGSTSVLLGSSGSGKSTLLNALAGTALNATGSVKAFNQRGKHTTTARTLFSLPNGAMIIDTPGLREVQLWLGEEHVGGAFPEIEEAAVRCKFSDCAHDREPGCAVQAALAAGSIPMERYQSWLRLAREARFLETRTNVFARLEEKAKWKRRSKAAKKLA